MSESESTQRARPQVALVALSVALVIVTAVAIWGWVDRPSTSSASAKADAAMQAATKAASQIALDLTTFDYRKLDEAWAKMQADGTSAFQDTLTATKADTQAFDRKMKVISQGTVTASSALPPAADDSVTVWLFVDQRLYSLGSSKGEIQPVRIQMLMRKANGKWLVDKTTVTNLS